MSRELTRIQKLRLNASKGGKATAKKHGTEFVQERGRKGGQGTLLRYGIEYFRNIANYGHSKKGND